MSFRVVVHAEGSRETGALTLRPRPGAVLAEDQLGAAHLLTRRCLVESAGLKEPAIQFIEPLRLGTGRVARGSSLLDRATLRRLLAWPDPNARPDLAVVLIDADGNRDRLRMLTEWTGDAMLRPVVGVAVEEFEAWLIADHVAVSGALGTTFPTPPAPESMRPREAKALLDGAQRAAGVEPELARRTIASLAKLDGIARRCSAFATFRSALAAAVSEG